MLNVLLNILLVLCSLFLICLVLIQRGRGGGLAGAFGGMGGSSAFGTKAGDVFTRITIITALVWFLLAMVLVFLSNRGPTSAFEVEGAAAKSSREVPVTGKDGAPKAGATTPTEGADASKAPATGGASKASTTPDEPADALPPALLDDEEPTAATPSKSAPEK